MSGDALDQVHRIADEIGLIVGNFMLDDQWHRVPVRGKKKNNTSGTYCLGEFRLKSGRVAIVGLMCNHAEQWEVPLNLDGIEDVTPEEIAEAKQRSREAAEASKKARAELQLETAKRASTIWDKLPDSGASLYLDNKEVKAWGIRFSRGSIVVPACDAQGKLWTLQFIDKEGNKRFLTGGAKRGRFHLIGRPLEEQAHLILGIAEGYATAASLHEALHFPIAIAFDAGNILPVSEALRATYPNARLVFFADHDIYKGYPQAFIKQSEHTPAVARQIARLPAIRPDVLVEVVADDDARLRDRDKHPNIGLAKALLAAAKVDGDVVVPRFEQNKNNEGSGE